MMTRQKTGILICHGNTNGIDRIEVFCETFSFITNVTFKNGTNLKISIYGSFFSESNSIYKVPEKYSKEFDFFISNMIKRHSYELEEKLKSGIKN